MSSRYRTHTCGALRPAHVDSEVRLAGWVHRKRDHGGLIFVDLRDHTGITQIVATPGSEAFTAVEQLRLESVIGIVGGVVRREAETVNPNLPTGEVEVRVRQLEVLSTSEILPFQINAEQDAPEELRLRYRFLDLRREQMQKNIRLRSQVISSIRRRMTESGFLEMQTPILTASSPEGARDFLVPSRLHPGQFYALPQAPQQFKQLLMVAGFDRYFQIAPCFRDEDARADRSPGEFYQLDLEMAFVEQDDVFAAVEPVLHGVFTEFTDWTVTPTPFPRIPYAEAMLRYGTDKPDLRNPVKMYDVTECFRGSGFKVFANAIAEGAVVRALHAPGGGGRPRSFFDKLVAHAQELGLGGLAYIVLADTLKGPIAKFVDEGARDRLRELVPASEGDAIFFVCDREAQAQKLGATLRERIGADLEAIEQGVYRFCWIVDFPFYERDAKTGRIEFSHNPFSMPQGGMEALQTKDPLTILAYQYDIVCNGVELSSGAIRNHRPDLMLKAFEIAGYPAEEVEARFGGMLRAFRFGAPPHGGIAPGIDRIVMLLAREPDLRQVIAFPMNQNAQDLLMGAPSPVRDEQLRELHIRLELPPPREG